MRRALHALHLPDFRDAIGAALAKPRPIAIESVDPLAKPPPIATESVAPLAKPPPIGIESREA
jgi:hypothetical protein